VTIWSDIFRTTSYCNWQTWLICWLDFENIICGEQFQLFHVDIVKNCCYILYVTYQYCKYFTYYAHKMLHIINWNVYYVMQNANLTYILAWRGQKIFVLVLRPTILKVFCLRLMIYIVNGIYYMPFYIQITISLQGTVMAVYCVERNFHVRYLINACSNIVSIYKFSDILLPEFWKLLSNFIIILN
jgi:hypothetical protein